jgi:hypothetical protein
MGSIVGFSLYQAVDVADIARAKSAQQRALSYYKHLESKIIDVDRTRLEVWGHPDITECLHRMADGDLLVRVGSPHNQVSWKVVEEGIQEAGRPEEYELPWEGRVVLVRISADGERWTMWNDWIGSIPVYHAGVRGGRLASTLEPVVVAGGGYTPDDFFLPGLVSLLINGHFLSDWTLYKDMKVVPPDSAAEWDENGFRWQQLWTVEPSQDRWESSWDDLVDEMYELSHKAIADVLKTQSSWVLPLSSGLDSRLIAGVGADIGADLHAFAWGEIKTTDVVYSRKIARTLGIPWKHTNLDDDFLLQYTSRWADLFGSAMHFHGMYLMSFLDKIGGDLDGSIVSGFLGDVLTGWGLHDADTLHSDGKSSRVLPDYYNHWSVSEIGSLFQVDLNQAIGEVVSAIQLEIVNSRGAWFQKIESLLIKARMRSFTNFQCTVSNYWRGEATPYMDRNYARFCLSLPRTALDGRRLLSDVFRRHYGRLAVIPGTYANEPFIRTGKYLLKRVLANILPPGLQLGPLRGFRDIQLRMDVDSLQATGMEALWPIQEAWERLSEWVDISQVEATYQAAMSNHEDIRPLRKLQSIQTLAYRLLDYSF